LAKELFTLKPVETAIEIAGRHPGVKTPRLITLWESRLNAAFRMAGAIDWYSSERWLGAFQ
jgi:hypothetical protein